MKFALAFLLLMLAAPAHAAFNPVEFFRGKTSGEGTLKVLLQAPKTIRVESVGRAEADGSLLLEQTIYEPEKPPRVRYWRLRQNGPNRFDGTLTDAASPVRVDVIGERVRIRYKAKNHLDFDQWLSPVDARTVRNTMRVKRFGITVAHYDELIRKGD
ncbi:MAG TPA: DUF3833 family protein [Sphingomicrobium sp.]|nr:DUF3833 family protein [Sphingomicrobium sp.]